MNKIVTCKKEHKCLCCERVILKNEKATNIKQRVPTYNSKEVQIGVEYFSYYLCHKDDCGTYNYEIEEKQSMDKL